jgi:hypothetical protein
MKRLRDIDQSMLQRERAKTFLAVARHLVRCHNKDLSVVNAFRAKLTEPVREVLDAKAAVIPGNTSNQSAIAPYQGCAGFHGVAVSSVGVRCDAGRRDATCSYAFNGSKDHDWCGRSRCARGSRQADLTAGAR